MSKSYRFSGSIAGLVLTISLPAGIALADGPDEGRPWNTIVPLLEKHCARCHQVGKTTDRFKDRPAGNFGFVLDEGELIKRNKLIPGNADGSEVFVKVLKGDMPKDIDDSCFDGTATNTTYCGLNKDEKAALHDAINALRAPPEPEVLASNTPAPALPPPPGPTADAGPPQEPSLAPQEPSLAPQEPPPPLQEPPPPVQSQTVSAPAQQGPTTVIVVPAPAQAPPPVPIPAPPPKVVFMTERDVIRHISDDVAQANTTDAPNYRYMTFSHMVNAGVPPKDLRVYRLALTKLVNSLSSESDPYVPVPIDPDQTIYRIDLRRLGWSTATWDSIVAADPYVILYNNAQFRSLQRDLNTPAPFVRADWFTFAAARPPLYYTVLDLPKTKGELQKKLGLDVARDFQRRQVQRAGFQQSGVSDNNREVERHSISTGAYWESYDFGANGDRKSLFEFPLGPPGAFGDMSDKFGFIQDGGEMIFSLPNGFHAYYLSDGKGNRLDQGPTRIVRDPSQRDLAVTNGVSCMGCHDKGIKYNDRRPGQPLDQVRDLVMHSGTYPPEVKEIVGEIFPTADDFNRRLDSDAKRYADALAAAGVNMNTKAEGVEMINAFSHEFEDNLNAREAAAEVGMTEAAFMDRLDAAGGQAHDLKLRLQQDLVPRDQFVTLFASLVNTINDDGDKAIDLTKVAQQSGTSVAAIANQGKQSPQTSKTFDLAFYANATSFKVGDLITFTLRSEQPCFLTLIDADDKGRSAVLFPNAFHPDGRIDPNTDIAIPGPTVGGFKIRAPEAGIERITASCNASFPDLAHQDFSKEKFATFANSRDLIAAQSDAQAREQARLSRLLVVEKSEGPLARPDVAGTEAPPTATNTDPNKIGQQLVANPIEPAVPITAQKSVVLNIRGK